MSELAQVSTARLRAPVESPAVRGFVVAVDRINRLAERSPGFLWRHQAHDGTDDDQRTILNLSVWQSYEHLHAYVYRSEHGAYVRRGAEWFEPLPTPTTALWWVPDGHRPAVDEALARLGYLRRCGPSPRSFSLRHRYDPDGRPEPVRPGRP
jgi:heme-degrading monooxygenase HmoA